MKKLFLSLAVVFSVALVSCGGNKAEQADENAAPEAAEEVVDATAAVVSDTLANDSVVNDTIVAVAAEEAPDQ